ncbi:BCCT family transporter [Citricoccus sp. NPDC055426]|uniref:BCCT family transporter n=1 Tax=Citricoccus sp. NPDC055426 TaxID=3155536 RepID=UPI00343F2A3E
MSTSDHESLTTAEEPSTPGESPGPAPETATTAGTGEPVHPAARIHENDSDEQVTEKLRLQGVRVGAGTIAPAVFWPSILIVTAVAVLAIAAPETTGTVLSNIQGWISTNLGWFYMLAIGIFIVVALALCFSKFGHITLGRDGEKPEYGILSWFAMLFAAGMGIGLVFYGVGEPLGYATVTPKPGWPGTETVEGVTSVLPGQEHAVAMLGMAQTFVHWGLHPWAIYAVIGLAVGYAIHRRGRPVSIRWALEPILGDRVKGWMGDIIDILAIFGTIFGIATSLGLGVQQIGAGLTAMGIVEAPDQWLLVGLIIIITLLATGSVVTGIGRGIKWLSNINLSLAAILVLSVLLLGPTLFLFQNFVQSIGVYLAEVLNMTFDVGAYSGEAGAAWGSGWTIFYWGWWVSWAPFVGVFIARISRGRTVRQFISGVLLVPTLVGFLWFSIMGGTGLWRQLFSDQPLVEEGAESLGVEAALFDVLGGLPLGGVLSVIAILLVAIFFITSSDSGSLVVDMLASGGHPNPPVWSRVLFAFLEGALAIGLLLAGGLGALQAASIATALPFSLVLLAMCFAIVKALKRDQDAIDARERRARYQQISERLSEDFDDAFGEQVDHRIDYRLSRTTGLFERRREPGADGSATQTADPSAAQGTAPDAGPSRGLFGRRRRDGREDET